MTIEVRVPALPESVADATLINWHKKPGDWVNKNENLVDLETDKVILEVPSPNSGILSQIIKEDGALVFSNDVLAILDTEASSGASGPSPAENKVEAVVAPASSAIAEKTTEHPASSAAQSLEAHLSPAVRRLIVEKNIDPAQIKGSGKHGRLTKNDVIEYLSDEPVIEQRHAPARHIEPEKPTAPIEVKTVVATGIRPEQRVPMTRLRAKIAERLLQAQQNAAMLTTFNEVNMHNVMELRNQYKGRFEDKHKIKLGFMSFFVKASIEALKKFPAVNASIDGNDIIYHGYYDIGIAVSTPRGLIVPVLRDADQLDFAGIEKSIADYGKKAKEGNISVDDLTGGTFTITNGGIFGSMLSTPILNPPQCAILGMHAIKERPVVENGEIVIRPIMYLALSYDHRLVDGREAVQFLATIKECLESPAHLLLNI
ncbi:2-oxoglutarate dehydrogenase complex dihydrolipoyllysine-residue succinyltransferase [Methylicorpusculum sp.]|uniref:2-oxoglutarate dehydrogenase complex dihydrolipoyllysine-residue succinyltransferase n=2 Tax=Methylicorpusculum sp. TaxID=2713644 RepID=UPI002721FCEB|nr:2-oxoglutarate dehydrogenase complex dihydrolipoyllysine-residue succinyltransferase [Methylicorpusculum sp.]MDO9239133.1 2-oxoglutarate dehydrogenase complex dihydrolipoyllysine-residue succinyltransferase [Methylicorpusculum sp.]MDP2180888.1 2-oxoglutarate dehydrogenase complex dihydrolipoyllysine-residue succinyltransferase [Methylicorpusculum sp.]MDP3528799.1 2-oxoglutarate dehydrogenase complex dihydrolipoyllysine-residue succinyltransferase [Methylicorpusculum sp.]